jgi:SAM-dependent methyltransferase
MSLKQAIKNVLPASIFQLTRDIPWMIQGIKTKAPKGQGPIPPLRLMFDGPRDYDLFLQTGQETLKFYKAIAHMKTGDNVLDIGCGIGRKTLPLLGYLENEALYVGMEIDRRGVDWLSRNVTSQNRRFVFLQQDIYNKFYNPNGALIAGELIFPFPAASFDMVVLWSVFTHMFPEDIAHYLEEIARVLKPGGTLAASFFLYNESILEQMQNGKTELNFSHELKDCRTTNPNIPEDAIAVRDSWLMETLGQLSMKPEQIMYGGWSGHTPHPDLPNVNSQDIVLAKKPARLV